MTRPSHSLRQRSSGRPPPALPAFRKTPCGNRARRSSNRLAEFTKRRGQLFGGGNPVMPLHAVFHERDAASFSRPGDKAAWPPRFERNGAKRVDQRRDVVPIDLFDCPSECSPALG